MADGIWVTGTGATANQIQGNLIGTDRLGTGAIPNRDDGISFQQGAHDNTVGDAGENVIVETDGLITEDHIAGGLMIERPGANIELKAPVVAEPCVPFTRYLLGDPKADLEMVQPHREFLRRGMRGYVMGLSNLTEAVEVEVGDLVYARR